MVCASGDAIGQDDQGFYGDLKAGDKFTTSVSCTQEGMDFMILMAERGIPFDFAIAMAYSSHPQLCAPYDSVVEVILVAKYRTFVPDSEPTKLLQAWGVDDGSGIMRYFYVPMRGLIAKTAYLCLLLSIHNN